MNEQTEGGWTALLYAAAQGYPRILRLLLDAGANPDIGNLLGMTPLIYGARYGNLEVCSVLLEYGANIDAQDIDWLDGVNGCHATRSDRCGSNAPQDRS